MRRWVCLAGAITAEVTGTLAMKGALEAGWLYAVMGAGYVLAFVLLGLTLRSGMALGIAYGIWGATGVAATSVLSLVLFGEPLTPLMIAGIVLIMGGVVLVELGSGRTPEPGQPTAHERTTEPGQASGPGPSTEPGQAEAGGPA